VATVRWTEQAAADLEDTYGFVARTSPQAAAALIARLFELAESLSQLSERGRRLPEFPGSQYREVLTSGYRVIYRAEAGAVFIAAIVSSRMPFDPRRLG
jgi:plasmid stabilization system protein ParE